VAPDFAVTGKDDELGFQSGLCSVASDISKAGTLRKFLRRIERRLGITLARRYRRGIVDDAIDASPKRCDAGALSRHKTDSPESRKSCQKSILILVLFFFVY